MLIMKLNNRLQPFCFRCFDIFTRVFCIAAGKAQAVALFTVNPCSGGAGGQACSFKSFKPPTTSQ